jgi:uncharacterized damage-inducible protein DinB
MKETERIGDELRRADHGDPWHGWSLQRITEDVTAGEASARPIPGAHTICEIVLHVAAWRGEVRERLLGGLPGEPPDGDWPSPARDEDAAWMAATARLATAHRELLGALARFPEARLDEIVGGQREPAVGTGVSYGVMLHGIAQHDAYHAGQIALLKKALRASEGGLRH